MYWKMYAKSIDFAYIAQYNTCRVKGGMNMVEKDRRTKNIQIRVTNSEKKSIEEQANKAGLSMAAYVRTTLMNNVQSAEKP